MELHDICDGCGRHPGVCMCSVSIGTIGGEGAQINRPNPTNFAKKLKIIAADAMLEGHRIKTQRLVDQIRWRATRAAKIGQFSLSIWLSDLDITKETAEMVAEDLRRDGLKCTISNEVTAMYSNTDWDSDDLLFISWE